MNRIKVVLVAFIAVGANAPLWGQANPTSEAQLNGGFLGQQNERLNKGANANDPFSARASASLAEHNYAAALSILRPYRAEGTVAYHFLTGQALEGLGDFAAARKSYAITLKKRRNFTAGQVALAVLEAKHGDKAAAAILRKELSDRRDACGRGCSSQAELISGVAEIDQALK